MAQHAFDRLAHAVRQRGTPVLVGLDPRLAQLPSSLQPQDPSDWNAAAAAYSKFCCHVIDVVAPLVAAVKPQAAFFEELGPAGMQALANIIGYARRRELFVILDGKRNDIGSTAEAYARAYLGPQTPWQADALTINPYLGDDSVSPFVDVAQANGAGIFVLVKTSNPGGGRFQDQACPELPLYREVGNMVEEFAGNSQGQAGYGLAGAVVGATYPEQLTELRAAMPHSWFLIPGFGAQGGTARDVAGGFDTRGLGAIVNNSRGILFAHSLPRYRDRFPESQWQRAVEAATRDMIAELRAETPAGKLPAPTAP